MLRGGRIKLWGIKLSRHLEQKHYVEVEVRKALAFPKKLKERQKVLLIIITIADHYQKAVVFVLIPKYVA